MRRFRGLCGLCAVLASACGAAHAPADAAIDDAVADDAALAATDAPFSVAAHGAALQIPSQGGATIASPRLVVITFANDTNRAAEEALDRYLVGSSWLTTVGAEYHVGTGTVLAAVERTDNAPVAVTDGDVQSLIAAGIADGTLPQDGAFPSNNIIYVVHYPASTRIMTQGGTSCVEMGGYHGFAQTPSHVGYPYIVLPTCARLDPQLSGFENTDVAAAHELIETMTDASPLDHPAYALANDSNNPWLLVGGELADMCGLAAVRSERADGYALPLVWSNAAAAAGTASPCIPAPAATPYYDVAISPSTILMVAAGATTTLTLRAWSTAPVADFTLRTHVLGAFEPTVVFSQTRVNNGDQVTLQLTVPAGTAHSSLAQVYLDVVHSTTDYGTDPIVIFVQ